jgi:hypothetical protein
MKKLNQKKTLSYASTLTRVQSGGTCLNSSYIGDLEPGPRNIALVNMTRIARALGTFLSRLIADMEKET